MSLHLVRHGRSLVEPDRAPHHWVLDPLGYDAVWALRDLLPARAAWFSSPEPKALGTAQLLTDTGIGIVDGLREHVRESTTRFEDFPAVVRRAFARPAQPAAPGWEPLDTCRERLRAAVLPLLSAHVEDDVVLVGHGTAWALLVGELTGAPPDLDRWETLTMPDLIVLDHAGGAPDRWRVRTGPAHA